MNTLGVLAWLEDARGEASWRAAIEPPPEVVKEEPAPKSLTEQLEEGIGVATMPSDGEEEAGGGIDLSPDISDEESSVFVSTYVGDLEDDDDLAAELASLRVDREEES
jgi:hypothetical protein